MAFLELPLRGHFNEYPHCVAQDKRGYQVFFFSYFSTKTRGYSLEAPQQGTSNEYPQHMEIKKERGSFVKKFACLSSAAVCKG